MRFIPLLAVLLTIAPSFSDDTNYRDEFFSWVWMPRMYQIAEDQGTAVTDIDTVALKLHTELEGENFNKQAWETEKAVKGLPLDERAEAYRWHCQRKSG